MFSLILLVSDSSNIFRVSKDFGIQHQAMADLGLQKVADWPIGGPFTEIAERMAKTEDLRKWCFDVLRRCDLVTEYDGFVEMAIKAKSTPSGVSVSSLPVLCFNAKRERHWKFTPQCEIYPIAKSILMQGFRQVVHTSRSG